MKVVKIQDIKIKIKNNKIPNVRTLRYLWSRMVKQRDKYICQVCGLKPNQKFLHAHHIKSFSTYPELAYTISNGKTVCILCHGIFHPNFKMYILQKPKKATKKEWLEYLKQYQERQIKMGKTIKKPKTEPKEKEMPMKKGEMKMGRKKSGGKKC